MGQSAREAGASVADTAAQQARTVAEETRRQAASLLDEAGSQARQQASAQQRKAAQNLYTLAGQLDDMATESSDSGMAAKLAREAANRVHGFAGWLDQREPTDLLDEVRDFARRRPGTFLIGAAVAGVLAGRMSRGIAAAGQSGGQRQAAGEPANLPVPAGTEPAGMWPAPGYGPVPPAMPEGGTGPATEYGGDLPGGTWYGSEVPSADYPGGERGPDNGGAYTYRPGQP